MNRLTIGVLAFQGAFAKHAEMVQGLGHVPVEIRKGEQLEGCDALIMPGGESTVMFLQIQRSDFAKFLLPFSQKKPIFGTCAGLILMSKEIVADPMVPFGLLDISVQRNAYGRQAESFRQEIELRLEKQRPSPFPAVFIRAPKIIKTGANVEILAQRAGEPILVQEGFHLGSTFHPELTGDSAIHEYFLQLVKKQKKSQK